MTEEEVAAEINIQKEEEQSLSWNKTATKLLISEYKERQDKMENGRLRKNKAFGEISEVMQKYGYKFTNEQCSTRFKTITRAYKQVKDQNARSGNGKKQYEYEKELDDLFGKRPNIQPQFVLGSATDSSEITKDLEKSPSTSTNKRSATSTEPENEDGNTGKSVSTPKCRKTQVSEVISYLDTYTKNKEKQHELEQAKRDERHKEKMSVFKEMISVMKGDQNNN